MMKKRFVAGWTTLPGAYHDEESLEKAIEFAQDQAKYNCFESKWFVIDQKSGMVVAQQGE
jgi:hypothetical protein